MRKLVLMAVAMALVTVLPAGAQAKTKTKQVSTGIYLDVPAPSTDVAACCTSGSAISMRSAPPVLMVGM
jgi:hypothetical protein